MSHTFWNTKPMAVSKNKQQPVLIQEEHGFMIPDLSPSLEWDSFDIDSDESKLEEITLFLEKHYISKGYLFQIIYSKEHLLFELKSKQHRIVTIRSKKQKGIVAMIGGSVRILEYQGKRWENILFINFLCVQQELRHLGLAPKLITEISRQVNHTWNIQQAYYISITELPVPFSKTTYFHRILNIHKCIQHNYWIPNKQEVEQWSKTIPEEKRIYCFEKITPTTCLNTATYSQIASWINDYHSRNKILFEKLTDTTIQTICQSACFEKYLIYNKSNIQIGFICFFYHPYRVLNSNTHDTLKTGVMYYYGICKEEEDNKERIVKEWMDDIRKENLLDVFTTTDCTVTDHLFVKGHSYYHYMYNVHMPEIDSKKIALIGL